MPDPYIPTTQKGAFFNATGWIIAIGALILVIAVVSFGIRWATAGPKGKLQAREQILSGANRISAYDHFFNLCASIQGLEGQLDAQYDQRAAASGDDLERVNANIAGITGARYQAVAQYNADARKDYTIGQFRSSQLPYQLPTSYDYKEGVHTSCVA